jgi:signal transduction histidine kinase
MFDAPVSVLYSKSLDVALREIPTFSDLTEDQMAWLASHMIDETFEAGSVIIRQGEPAEYMTVMLEGEIRYQTPGDTQVFVAHSGEITGLLPYSRLKQYGGNVTAITRIRGARLHKTLFPEMLGHIPALGPRLVALMADRIRRSAYQDVQHEKLVALGKLSAGLAHELNNPASAARQASTELRTWVSELRSANHELASYGLTEDHSRCLVGLEQQAIFRQANNPPLGTVERSDHEDVVGQWLAKRGIETTWQYAPILVDGGFTVALLDDVTTYYSPEMLPAVIRRLAATLSLERSIGVIDDSTKHISHLVQSVKDYSFMDQAPIQEIDLHPGIENTLEMLAHQLRQGVTVVREFDRGLPRIQANGSELNQVWTELIQNAIEAMNCNGTLTIHTQRELDMALIEIVDDGPGIPEAIQSRIFEPFFTTKEVGDGTGLGLDMVFRAVQRHRGSIRFETRPGETRFQVRLPLPNVD